jgi:hypothetical protein
MARIRFLWGRSKSTGGMVAGCRLRQPPPLMLWRSRGYGGTRDDHPGTAPRASENFFKLFLRRDTRTWIR